MALCLRRRYKTLEITIASLGVFLSFMQMVMEPSLLQNIRARFARQQAYTYTGEMELLALNPYTELGLYTPSTCIDL